MGRLWLASVLLLTVACRSGSEAEVVASADPDRLLTNGMTARQMVDARALHMKDLGGSFKSVRDQLKSSNPNTSLVRIAAQEVKFASDDLPTWFPEGTGPDTGLEMRAFAKVWSDPEGFAAASAEFQESAAALHASVQREDLEGTSDLVRAVGASCKGCHDRYRAEED